MKATLFISILMLSFGIYAQSDTLNQKDSLGKKQGYWIIYGKDEPQKGYPDEGKIWEGTYIDDRKNGQWILYHKDGMTPKTKGYFVNNRPRGPFEKYYPNGNLKEKGMFKKGPLTIYWENGNIKREAYFNEERKRHGKEIYYFENSQVELEMKFNNGILIDTLKAYYPTGELRYMAILDSLGREIKNFTGPQAVRDSLTREINSPRYLLPFPYDGKITEKSDCSHKKEITLCSDNLDIDTNEVDFKTSGYNKLYTKYKNLLLDGEFKNGCLWDGKYYIYDKDGLLLKVEIYKEGRYHSDGQL